MEKDNRLLSEVLRSEPLGEKRPVLHWNLRMIDASKGLDDPLRVRDQDHYRLVASVEISYWASRTDYEVAEKVAKRALLAWLYSDVLEVLPELRLRVLEMNERAVLEIIDRIERRLRVQP